MSKLDHKEGWEPENWCFLTVVLEKTLESPLDCKEIHIQIFKSTAETFVQIYKEKEKKKNNRSDTMRIFVINRFVWNRSLLPWTSLPKEVGKDWQGNHVQNLLRVIFGAKLSFSFRNFHRAMKSLTPKSDIYPDLLRWRMLIILLT